MITVICTVWRCSFIVTGTGTGVVALSMSYRCDMLGILLNETMAILIILNFYSFILNKKSDYRGLNGSALPD
ncbi:hypothetical protein E4659_19130 [Dickeya dianthicola]|uniref:hypothetical protein n=1 Tax=Dickeya dianthicola TaxID=204039 RepID=UPI0004150D96|nr:hypothetical protein [Dickeya dianthicola]ATO34696.1 hypothetical protein DDI_3528 [Dickeya dianthicola RNS04.9]MBI0438349.1 hypothetical protein [Dickeya dianthicola]MBI0449606.1 hypothetical protein [Dickeya dianthicola]MBI0454169.1 hypothetical protein [Dickeya dianthicola]MBI0458346.1 hypothetical protein [Dickeya dianthicola]